MSDLLAIKAMAKFEQNLIRVKAQYIFHEFLVYHELIIIFFIIIFLLPTAHPFILWICYFQRVPMHLIFY